MPVHALKLALAVALLSATALPAAAESPPFEATGELRFHGYGSIGTSAAFDDQRLVGPTVNLTRREDGTWGGDLAGQDMDLTVTATRVSGPNVNLILTRKGDRVDVEGLFFNTRFRVTLDAKRLTGRFGDCSFDMTRRRDGSFNGDVGCLRRGATFPVAAKATLTFLGQAADASPPQPQFALALLAVLPS